MVHFNWVQENAAAGTSLNGLRDLWSALSVEVSPMTDPQHQVSLVCQRVDHPVVAEAKAVQPGELAREGMALASFGRQRSLDFLENAPCGGLTDSSQIPDDRGLIFDSRGQGASEFPTR